MTPQDALGAALHYEFWESTIRHAPEECGMEASSVERILAALARDGWVLVNAETLAAPVARFVRRVGGLTVRVEDGKEYVRVPSEWIDDLTAYLAALRGDTDA